MVVASLHYGLPLRGGYIQDFTTVVLKTASWETTCLMSPTSRISGRPPKLDEQVQRLRAGMESTERGRQVLKDLEVPEGTIPVLQCFLHNDTGEYPIVTVNPALELPAVDPKLELSRKSIVETMQNAAKWSNDKARERFEAQKPS